MLRSSLPKFAIVIRLFGIKVVFELTAVTFRLPQASSTSVTLKFRISDAVSSFVVTLLMTETAGLSLTELIVRLTVNEAV
ncbi:hypothetical protein SDC9_180063 [bioreactor metagenome]|uniref:Uncharacterized protein n=1 Tax=bioreactor metagenome TaxID=1076179 RepID=A0A645H9W7_9ZZZZ